MVKTYLDREKIIMNKYKNDDGCDDDFLYIFCLVSGEKQLCVVDLMFRDEHQSMMKISSHSGHNRTNQLFSPRKERVCH